MICKIDMIIPYVIDNQKFLLADVLNVLLQKHKRMSLDVATAYFTIQGFRLLKDGLLELGNFRMLLGAEPQSGEQVGLRPEKGLFKGLLRRDLEQASFSEETFRLVEDLIRFLRRENAAVRVVEGQLLHAKGFIFYSDRPGQQMLFDRFRPVVAIVGSSNFTSPGLTTNRELNLAHKVLLDETEVNDSDAERAVAWLADEKSSDKIKAKNKQLIKSEVGARAIIELESWFEGQWSEAKNFKEELISILDASKFGQMEYTPYQIYMKALFEYFKDDLGADFRPGIRSAVELAEFQEDAVKKARKILARYDGVLIGDSVGLGKTWIGKKLLEDFAYHLRQKALIICPASLRDMWKEELHDASISAVILSQEELGQADYETNSLGDVDVILIDESHNFRNRAAQRYENLERLISQNGGKGREGARKKIILLTATPINNDLFDLYNQINLLTQGDRSYFSAAGIGDLYRYFLNARRDTRLASTAGLFNLLEEIVVRRTRAFIRKAYPEATIKGERIKWPERRLHTVNYNLEATYSGIYERMVSGIESLRLAPYNLESYKKAGVAVDEFERGREEALVGIFKSRYLKRVESSIEAFRISVRRALEFLKTFETYIMDGRVLSSSDFQKVMRYLEREEEEDDATPTSRADELDASEEAREVLKNLPELDASNYDLRRLHEAIQHDIEALTDIWYRIKDIRAEGDKKLKRLEELLTKELRGQKVLIFTYYKDTARYLFRALTGDSAKELRQKIGNPNIRRMDSGASPKDRTRIIEAFAPQSNRRPELSGSEEEIDILISTDVLSEGQNLQDCGHLLNYDLHWNPTRMVQRAGRIDRIGARFDTLQILNMFPDAGLERLLGLLESLMRKIADIDRTGFLDASVLGEVVHPQSFNTLRRIKDEDNSVIEEEEGFSELASNEFLLQHLRQLLEAGGSQMLDELPDGIHSGLCKPGAQGVFFYFVAPSHEGGRLHFWRYYDLRNGKILDNRYLIANYIHCGQETPRVIPSGIDIFEIQEKVVAHVLRSEEERKAIESAPKIVDPAQQLVATALQGYLNHPELDRRELVGLIGFLSQPLPRVYGKRLKVLYKAYVDAKDIKELVDEIKKLRDESGKEERKFSQKTSQPLKKEDLHLICFDYLSA
jgi:SNF2 family DNA or RNA helicase